MIFRTKKGSVAVYALLSMAVLVALLFSIYIIVNMRYKSQLKTASNIRKEVEQYNLENEVEVIENPTEIYLYEQWQFDKMKSDQFVYIPQENKIYKFTSTAKYLNIASFIPIGDTVIYNPTTGATSGQLTYTSVVGNAKENENAPGNGCASQTFTATAGDNEWIVLGKENGQLKLMSKEPKIPDNPQTDQGGIVGFAFKDGRGSLYAEEELHRASAIYGYGNGADKSKITTFTIGNSQITNGTETKTLTGSGARSITIEDLQEITTIKLTEDNPTMVNFTAPVYMPSLTGVDILGKCKDTDKKQNIPITRKITSSVDFSNNIKEEYVNLQLLDIFKNNPYYWLASRSIYIYSQQINAEFCVNFVSSTFVSGSSIFYGSASSVGTNIFARGIRPVVYLEKTAQIDKTETPGQWLLEQ